MENMNEFNSLAFITQGGLVSITVALVLLAMSLASWYLIFVKSYQLVTLRRAANKFSSHFWQASSLEAALNTKANGNPVSRLASQAVEAAEHHQQHASKRLADACSRDEFIARAMRRA